MKITLALMALISGFVPISLAQGPASDPDLSGTWLDGAASKITFNEKGDEIQVREMDGDRVIADFSCNLSGQQCDVKEAGHTVKVTMYYNGSKLVEITERGNDVEKRRFSLGQDGATMQMEIIPLSSPNGKATTRTYRKQQDSQVAKNGA
jgi:hypothetical protein